MKEKQNERSNKIWLCNILGTWYILNDIVPYINQYFQSRHRGVCVCGGGGGWELGILRAIEIETFANVQNAWRINREINIGKCVALH